MVPISPMNNIYKRRAFVVMSSSSEELPAFIHTVNKSFVYNARGNVFGLCGVIGAHVITFSSFIHANPSECGK